MDASSPPIILYIEDEESLAALVKRRLKRSGYEVEHVATGEQGLELILNEEFSAVIVDYNLPGMSGIQLLEKLVELEIVTPTIMVSGQDDIRIAVNAMNLGCKDYLVKDGNSYLELLPLHLESVVSRRKLEIEKEASDRERYSIQKNLARAQSLAHIGNWEWHVGDEYARWSEEEYRVFGLNPSDYPLHQGVTLEVYKQRIFPDDLPLVEAMENRTLAEKKSEFEYRILLENGDIRWLHARNDSEFDDDGTLVRCFGTTQDISDRKLVEQQLVIAQQVFESTVEGILVADKDEKIISVNPAFTFITGYEKSEVLGKTPAFLHSGKHDALFYKTMHMELDINGIWSGEIWNRNKRGELYAEWLSITAIKDNNGQVEQYVSIFSDISQHKENEKLIKYQANYDSLTGLPNRNLFNDRLSNALKIAQREDRNVALFFLDLDRFKWVNDTLGHRAGDMLLKEVATRLKRELRDSDSISRLGGDEFTIVLADLEQGLDAEMIAVKILEAVAEPYLLDQQEVSITASLGIATYPMDGDDIETLYRNADNAMYAAKEAGRNQFSFYTHSMQQQAESRLVLLNELRQAIDSQQFELYYQPVIDIKSNKLHGAEALIRWNHPTRGIIPPGEFIGLAEDTGLIQSIGNWVINQALNQIRSWNALGHHLHVAINKSAKQFNSDECADGLVNKIKAFDVDPQQITIEITESVLMGINQNVLKLLKEYRQFGINISLDDFGTGYSSLSYLRKFPFDVLKIDRSFVMDVQSQSQDTSLIETMILMGHNLGLKVVAEGVETPQQSDFLTEYSCDYLQGYLYSPPIPADQFEQRFIINQEWKKC